MRRIFRSIYSIRDATRSRSVWQERNAHVIITLSLIPCRLKAWRLLIPYRGL